MATPQQQHRKTRRELERDIKARDRKKLQQLRADIRAAKRERAAKVRTIRSQCRRAQRAQLQRDQAARDALRQSIARVRSEAKRLCSVRVDDTREQTGRLVQEAITALAEELGNQEVLRVWTRPDSCPVTLAKGERGRESDCEVRSNLDDPGLLVVWERVKRKIRPGPRRSRTEAFLEWVHDHSADVWAIQEEEAAKALADLERAERRQAREVKKVDRLRKRTTKALQDKYDDVVPF